MDILMILILLICCLVLSKFIKYKEFKSNKPAGDYGESIVAKKLSQLSDLFTVSNDVYFGKAQIDHVVICHSRQIIFSIETKLWGGIVTGAVSDKKWVQFNNGNTNYFDNPIIQNQYHCREIRKVYPGYKVYNIVVFVRNTSVPRSSHIITVDKLLHYINKVSVSPSVMFLFAILTGCPSICLH